MSYIFVLFVFCLMYLHLHDAYDYEKDWPTTGTLKDETQAERHKIVACKEKCPQVGSIEAMMETGPGKFVKADYDKFCSSAPKSVKCLTNCYPKDDKWRKLDAKLGDVVDDHCSPGYKKHLACFKTVHDDKKVAACLSKCGPKSRSKTAPLYQTLPDMCKQMECQSKCQKQELLSKCKKEGKDAFAGYIKKKIHLLKSLAWAHYHMDKNKRISFTDVCDKITY